MQIDKGFYTITQANSSLATLSSEQTNAQEFAQILAQEIQSQDTQSQAKLTGIVYDDGQNGLLSAAEKDILPVTIAAVQDVVGINLKQQKVGWYPSIYEFDINFDPVGGRVRQEEILTSGSKAEKESLLKSYLQTLENGYVIPRGGKKDINIAINYINKVLDSL